MCGRTGKQSCNPPQNPTNPTECGQQHPKWDSPQPKNMGSQRAHNARCHPPSCLSCLGGGCCFGLAKGGGRQLFNVGVWTRAMMMMMPVCYNEQRERESAINSGLPLRPRCIMGSRAWCMTKTTTRSRTPRSPCRASTTT